MAVPYVTNDCQTNAVSLTFVRSAQSPKLNGVGTVARVLKLSRIRRAGIPLSITLYLEGVCRFSFDSYSQSSSRVSEITQLEAVDDDEAKTPSETEGKLIAEFKVVAAQLIDALQSRIAGMSCHVITVLCSCNACSPYVQF